MVTLTYRDDVDWSPRQVSNYLKCVREWARRKGIFIHYVWVLELTKRGRPHYHVLFWLPKGVSMPKADKQGWWKHGMTRSEWAYSPVGYLCKYTSKGIDFDSWGKIASWWSPVWAWWLHSSNAHYKGVACCSCLGS